MNKKNEKKLDDALVIRSNKFRCVLGGGIATEFHHYIGRRNRRLRWDIKNLVPLSRDKHRLVEDGKIELNWKHIDYLMENKNELLKDHIAKQGLTEDEFTKMKLKELKEWN